MKRPNPTWLEDLLDGPMIGELELLSQRTSIPLSAERVKLRATAVVCR